ncbi:hypothetical protein COCON_G00086380 [Conger conger]|uniref:Ig-like domain-containing protein n=1 Tax=Conger conger TaxID=82655 RepID=A0A9Q1I0E9_CONCO|nr:hypothetical protein COCON_G00086380 [Conger conger]
MSLRMLWMFVLPAAYCLDVYLETKEVTAEIGRKLVLKCGVLEPCEELGFRWGPKGDRPFPNYSERNLSPTESELTIDPVTTDHKGKIECKVFCKGKLSNNKVAQVKVYSFPADPVVSGNDRLRYGEQSDLTCLVRGLYLGDKLKIEWLQGKEVLKVESEFPEEDAAPALSSVYSYTPRLGDGKTNITCRASVPVNQQTRHTTANLTVHSPPRITTVTVSPSGEVQEGQNVSVSCRAVSSPPARFVLTREGGGEERVSQDGTFWIPQVKLQDAGLYQLNVSNQLGHVTKQLTLNVTAPPRITTVTVSPSGEVQEGQNVSVSCRAVSSPPARFVLTREGGGEERVSQDGTFWIPQVKLQDAGLYQLNVSNQLGHVTKQLTLNVTGRYEASTLLIKVLVPAIGGVAMVTTGAMVTMRHLRKMKAYELTKDTLSML